MTNSPTLSILTVVRNDLDGLIRTVQSTLSQDWSDWELLIKDGNSNDGTFDRANEYAQLHDRICIVPGKDCNLYDAMNIALAAARGTFVMCLNAGDVYASPHALAKAMVRMQNGSKSTDIGFFGTRVTMDNGRHYLRPARSIDYIRYGQPAIHQSTIIRRSLHLHQLYDYTAYPNIADYVAVARLIASGAQAESFREVLAKFEINEQSSSFVNQSSARSEFIHAIAEIWEPPLYERLFFQIRRWFAQKAVRLLMR